MHFAQQHADFTNHNNIIITTTTTNTNNDNNNNDNDNTNNNDTDNDNHNNDNNDNNTILRILQVSRNKQQQTQTNSILFRVQFQALSQANSWYARVPMPNSKQNKIKLSRAIPYKANIIKGNSL